MTTIVKKAQQAVEKAKQNPAPMQGRIVNNGERFYDMASHELAKKIEARLPENWKVFIQEYGDTNRFLGVSVWSDKGTFRHFEISAQDAREIMTDWDKRCNYNKRSA